jgi:hypothetical protein
MESVAATLADQVQTRPLLKKQEALKKEKAKERDKERGVQPSTPESGGNAAPSDGSTVDSDRPMVPDNVTDADNESDTDSPLLNNDDRELDRVFEVSRRDCSHRLTPKKLTVSLTRCWIPSTNDSTSLRRVAALQLLLLQMSRSVGSPRLILRKRV